MTQWQLPPRYKATGVKFGGGGMGEAFVCEDEHLERDVLVKTLQEGIDQKRITDELRALSEIRSKHVVQIYDVVKDASGDVRAIVEELLSGPDLTQTGSQNNRTDFFRLTLQIATGIADIHEHGRVHRDIKPNNMKYDSEGVLKIFDFGLSRIQGIDSATLAKIGTPGFMAPELFMATKGGSVQFSKAVDTFAFGSTALYCGTGVVPKCLMKFPPALPCSEANFSNLPFALPEEVRTTLNQCFSYDPVARPEMGQVRDVIAKYILSDSHRAQLVVASTLHTLSATNRVVNIAAGNGRGGCRLTYDGHAFVFSEVTGFVAMNNIQVANGMQLVGSCVLAFGHPDLGGGRLFIPIDISNPEVNA